MVASAIATVGDAAMKQEGRRPQHDADTEVRGDPPRIASTSAARPPTNPPTPSIDSHQTDSGVAEIEELERNRDGEHDRRTGDDRLQAVQRRDERQLAPSQRSSGTLPSPRSIIPGRIRCPRLVRESSLGAGTARSTAADHRNETALTR